MDQRRDELQSRLIERATRDQEFRQELLARPREVVQRELGLQLPPDLSIEVVEETRTTAYLVLPRTTAAAGQQLSDRELEAVAGGDYTSGTICGVCRATP